MKTNPFLTTAAIVSSLTCVAYAGGESWSHDFAAAKKQAAEQKKDLLLDFTGSDWCGWCIKLNKEVFAKPEFNSSAPKDFVLVEVDFPRDKSKLSPETIKQNDELGKKFAIEGYPTIVLSDAEGLPYAQTGYQEGGPAAYLTHLQELRKFKQTRDEAFAAANNATGVERAKLYIKGLDSLKQSGLAPATITSVYAPIIEKIKEADAKDETGYGKKAQAEGKATKLEADINELAQKNDFKGVIARIDTALADPDFPTEINLKLRLTKAMVLLRENQADAAIAIHNQALADERFSKLEKQEIYASLAGIYVHGKNSEKAIAALDEAKKIDPNSELGKNIEKMKEQMLDYLKNQEKQGATEKKDK